MITVYSSLRISGRHGRDRMVVGCTTTCEFCIKGLPFASISSSLPYQTSDLYSQFPVAHNQKQLVRNGRWWHFTFASGIFHSCLLLPVFTTRKIVYLKVIDQKSNRICTT